MARRIIVPRAIEHEWREGEWTLPHGHTLLSIIRLYEGTTVEVVNAYFEVDPDVPEADYMPYRWKLFAAGDELPTGAEFIGSYHTGGHKIWHLYCMDKVAH